MSLNGTRAVLAFDKVFLGRFCTLVTLDFPLYIVDIVKAKVLSFQPHWFTKSDVVGIEISAPHGISSLLLLFFLISISSEITFVFV